MNESLNNQVSAREVVIDYLLEQVLGPQEHHKYIGEPLPEPDGNNVVWIPSELDNSAFHDPSSGYAIIQNTRPEMVFGTGILHSPEQIERISEATDSLSPESEEMFPVPEVPQGKYNLREEAEEELSSIDQSQRIRPSAFGFTGQVILENDSKLIINLSGAYYEQIKVSIPNRGNRQWFRRVALADSIEILWADLRDTPNKLQKFPFNSKIGEYAELQIRWRETGSLNQEGQTLKAITVVVAHKGVRSDDLFQVNLSLEVNDGGYFDSSKNDQDAARTDLEEQENDFLYRHVLSYAVGHGVAVNWNAISGDKIQRIYTDFTPIFHQEMINTAIPGFSLRMSDIAEKPSAELEADLLRLVDSYGEWISQSEVAAKEFTIEQQEVFGRLLGRTRIIEERMRRGVKTIFTPGNEDVLEAFRISNKAMYLQQQRGRLKRRNFDDRKGQKLAFDPIEFPDEATYGNWRPFQIGFLLMAIPGLVDPFDEDRETVDLIFFPTGGGKTEAYLAAAAMMIVFRRLTDRSHAGVDVLMRYTLRLLTVQQFERSSGLIVALEYLRRRSEGRLGINPISIGVWLGDKTTPNKRSKAVEIFEGKDNKDDSANPFILSKCPWCGAAFEKRVSNKSWIGYAKSTTKPSTLLFVCGDMECDFSKESTCLPIWITDEDVYDKRPSFVLGTVDKFAQLSWEEKSRTIFSLNAEGKQIGLPPGLIIQDELHLISGPLGSLVGLYETVIDELCSYEIDGRKVKAKIIASTATTRRYSQQIKSLYGRENVCLFPQASLRSNETFFSSVLLDKSGKPSVGTAYLGINPATYATGQLAASQISAFLSQAPSAWKGDEQSIDYYSTSVWFFNSLKELGQTLTLMQSTVVSLLSQMWQDRRLPTNKRRFLDPIMELTGRVSSSQVAKSLSELNIKSSQKGSVVTCLASSIMEVGVDVQRLGLLTIMGQPKLTAQYIQVSGRVGRDPKNGPGLVIMLYNSNRARDRSVYEHFYPYHRKLYAQVEPLSVTPFAIQTMEKGLAGAFIALYRLRSQIGSSPKFVDLELFEETAEVFKTRLRVMQSPNSRLEDFETQINRLRNNWALYEPINWVYERNQEEGSDENLATALLRRRPEALEHIPGDSSINIPQSMRSVDGQTEIIPASNVYNFKDQRVE